MNCQNVKIFGERNTATNAIKQIIVRNSQSMVFPGASAEEIDISVNYKILAFNIFTRPLKSIFPYWRAALRESFEDSVFARNSAAFAWKHSATYFSDLESLSVCHVVFCVRHPYSWIKSFFVNPYHITVKKAGSLAEFIETRWRLLDRDNLPHQWLFPHEMYEEKLRSYIDLSEKLELIDSSFSFVRFEDVVMNQSEVFSDLSNNLFSPFSVFSPLNESTKDNDKDLGFY